jgi:hypothetical protein
VAETLGLTKETYTEWLKRRKDARNAGRAKWLKIAMLCVAFVFSVHSFAYFDPFGLSVAAARFFVNSWVGLLFGGIGCAIFAFATFASGNIYFKHVYAFFIGFLLAFGTLVLNLLVAASLVPR